VENLTDRARRAIDVARTVLARIRGWSLVSGAKMTDMGKSSYDNVDPVVLYDMFAEAANRVIACHVAAIDGAGSDADRDLAKARVREVRDLRHAVDVDDRGRQVQLIEVWNAEFTHLHGQQGSLGQ
jgi:hypothetical protein